MKGAYLGPEFSPDEIETYLRLGGRGVPPRSSRDELIDADGGHPGGGQDRRAGSTAGWSSGRARWARAASWAIRAIREMQAQMNIKIKFREGFRPFAPSVLRERVADYFELDADSPYMLLVAPVREERRIPMTDEQQKLLGHRQAQRAPLGHSGRHPHRLLGPGPDGDAGRPIRRTTT